MSSTPQRAYRAGIRIVSAAILVLGALIVIVTVTAGGGIFSLGVVMGVLFMALGAARMHLLKR